MQQADTEAVHPDGDVIYQVRRILTAEQNAAVSDDELVARVRRLARRSPRGIVTLVGDSGERLEIAVRGDAWKSDPARLARADSKRARRAAKRRAELGDLSALPDLSGPPMGITIVTDEIAPSPEVR